MLSSIFSFFGADSPSKTGHTSPPAPKTSNTSDEFWGKDGFSFGDLVDIINPLQHIPVVSSIYREITGDEVSEGSKMAGGTLFGGIAGLVSSFFGSTIEQSTGKDIGSHLVATFFPQSEDNPKVQLAQTATPIEKPEAATSVSEVKTGPQEFSSAAEFYAKVNSLHLPPELPPSQNTVDMTA